MDLKEVSELCYGDEVQWNDPDNGICTKILTIQSVQIKGEVVCITCQDGDYVECFASELS